MDRDVRLKQFAGALFSYVYREYNSMFEGPVKLPHVFNHHAAAECSDEEGKAVLKLCQSLRTIFNGPFVRAYPQVQKSTQHFMTFLTSRCLKLCGEDVFLSFTMICAFIAELNLFCWVNGCYAYMSTAPKCLTAIFNRQLKREFYANGGWDGLRIFCESFVRMNGKVPNAEGTSAEHMNGDDDDVINHDLLNHLQKRLDESSSSEEDSDTESESESKAEEQEAKVDEEESETDVENAKDSDDESESSEESDSSEESMESELEPGQVNSKVVNKLMSEDSDDDTEESDPSSMSEEEETESEDSESDVVPGTEQTNCLKPIMQENLTIEKNAL